jgi:HD-GYP domain-containing protein (c-di-GMP phosphodiesterase class II)
MPLSIAANFMESLDDFSAKLSHLKDEQTIVTEAIALIASTLPASAYAILQITDNHHHAVVLQATGEWRDSLNTKVSLSGAFWEEPDFFRKPLPVEMHSPSLKIQAPAFCAIPLEAQQYVWGYAFGLFLKPPHSTERSYLRTAFHIAAEAIVGACLRKRVERFRDQMDLLTAVEHAMNSSLTLSVTQNVLLDACLRVLEADAAALWVLDAQEGSLSLAAKRGFNRTYPLDKHFAGADSLASRAFSERHQVTQTNRPDEKNPARIMRVEKFQHGYALPLMARGECKGVLEVYSRIEQEPTREWAVQLEKIGTQATIAVDHAMLIGSVERASIQLSVTCDSAIDALSRAVDLRTKETEGHSRRIADLTVQMAEKAKIPSHQMLHIHRGALLHDVGKIGVPDSVLWKPGSYNEADWEWMRRHPQFAFDILQSLEVLQPAMVIPQYHHERWDGKGYPHGLAGNQIPLAARLFAVVDCWDSMLAERPYRQPLAKADVLAAIQRGAGNQFDPEAVRLFLNLLTDSEESRRY